MKLIEEGRGSGEAALSNFRSLADEEVGVAAEMCSCGLSYLSIHLKTFQNHKLMNAHQAIAKYHNIYHLKHFAIKHLKEIGVKQRLFRPIILLCDRLF